MKIYRMERDGVGIWRLSGIVDRDDACVLMRSLRESGELGARCLILDFENVIHIDYRVIELLECWFLAGPNAVFSGLSDYVLDIFAFVGKEKVFPLYSNWQEALRYLLAEHGKLHGPTAAGASGSKRHA